jgi:hypothetical protein
MGPFARFMNMIGLYPNLDNLTAGKGGMGRNTHLRLLWRSACLNPMTILQMPSACRDDVFGHATLIDKGHYTGRFKHVASVAQGKGVEWSLLIPFTTTKRRNGRQWIPIRMGTGTALAMAIAFVWIRKIL